MPNSGSRPWLASNAPEACALVVGDPTHIPAGEALQVEDSARHIQMVTIMPLVLRVGEGELNGQERRGRN